MVPGPTVSVLLDVDDLHDIHVTLTDETTRLRHAFEQNLQYRVPKKYLPIKVVLDNQCPLVAVAVLGPSMREALSGPLEARVPLMSAMPPHRTLAGKLSVTLGVKCSEEAWNGEWADLEGREFSLAITLAQIDVLPFPADR